VALSLALPEELSQDQLRSRRLSDRAEILKTSLNHECGMNSQEANETPCSWFGTEHSPLTASFLIYDPLYLCHIILGQ